LTTGALPITPNTGFVMQAFTLAVIAG